MSSISEIGDITVASFSDSNLLRRRNTFRRCHQWKIRCRLQRFRPGRRSNSSKVQVPQVFKQLYPMPSSNSELRR